MVNILYEDNHLIVVEKPINVPSQKDDTNDADMQTILKNYIKGKYNKPGEVYIGIVHRLDRPVGGVMVFARTSKAASRLSEQIRNNTFKKEYLAVVHGNVEPPSGSLEHFLLKNTALNIVKTVSSDIEGAKQALLDYMTLETCEAYSLLNIKLHTGRPHQIRVQLSQIGNPLYGDQKYGSSVNKAGMQIALWSNKITLSHPTLRTLMVFESKPPRVKPWIFFVY